MAPSLWVLACQAIRQGEIDVAIAGAVNLSLHPNKYNLLSDLLAHAETFEPGQAEYLIVDEATGMAVEIRRRGTPAVASTDNNPYLRRLEFAAPK